jgi:hypothetical protein
MTAPEGCGSKFWRLRKGALRYAFLTSICRSSKSFNAAMQRMARIDSQRATGANVKVKSRPKIWVRSFCDEATLKPREQQPVLVPFDALDPFALDWFSYGWKDSDFTLRRPAIRSSIWNVGMTHSGRLGGSCSLSIA